MRHAALALLAACTLSACGDDPAPDWPTSSAVSSGGGAGQASPPGRTRAPAPNASATSDASDEPPPPKVEFQEGDFMESERSRDPFRSFADLFDQQSRKSIRSQRTVILSDYALDELRLIAVVTRITPAKAMVVDPTGKGHVIHRGELVGRAERVQGASIDADYDVNWRVDRIREADVVLVREDPSNPDVPTATRVLSLHGDEVP